MTIPSLRVNGNVPRPDGIEADSEFALGDTVTLSLASTVGIGSMEYRIVKPASSTAALGSATPAAPFSTTLGPLDAVGTYLIDAIANGDPASIKRCAITVRAANGVRLPAVGESDQWDADGWWEGPLREVVTEQAKRVDGESIVTIAAAAVTLSAAQYANRIIRLTGAGSTTQIVNFPALVSGQWVVRNETPITQNLRVTPARKVAIAPAATAIVQVVNGDLQRAVSGDFGEEPLFVRQGLAEHSLNHEYAAGMTFRGVERWTTNDASATEIGLQSSIVTIANSTVLITATATAQKSDSADSFAARVVRAYKVDGSNVATAIAAQQSLFTPFATAGAAGMALDLIVNGVDEPDVQITGRAGETWRWTVHYEIQFITQAA